MFWDYWDGTMDTCSMLPFSLESKTDLSTQDLGFATFDTVDKDSKDFDGWKEIKEDSLSDLVSQSMLVSLYEN